MVQIRNFWQNHRYTSVIVQCIRSDNSEQRVPILIKRTNYLAIIKIFLYISLKASRNIQSIGFVFFGNWVYNAYVWDCLENRCKTPAVLKNWSAWSMRVFQSLCLQSKHGCDVLNMRICFEKYTLQKQRRTSSRGGLMIVHWKSTPKFCMSGLNHPFYYAPPPPTPFESK